MKAKLIKTEVNYILENDKGVVIASTSLNKEGLSLSIKNCQAIERGYDLDELANEYVKNHDIYFNNQIEKTHARIAFIEGLQKALEILGDKKFSEEDLRTAYGVGYLMKINPSDEYHETLNGLVQLLQQTEWEVIVEMEPYHDGGFINDGKTHSFEPTWRPKLDADGCLILKSE